MCGQGEARGDHLALVSVTCDNTNFSSFSKVGDVLGEIPTNKEGSVLNNKYKLILDKGLFDTITSYKDAARIREKYIDNTHKLLKSDGILLIATCCHTEQELKRQVANKGTTLTFVNILNYIKINIKRFKCRLQCH